MARSPHTRPAPPDAVRHRGRSSLSDNHLTHEAQLAAFRVLARLAASSTDAARVCATIAEVAATLLHARVVRVWVNDPGDAVLRAECSYGVEPRSERELLDFTVVAHGAGIPGRIVLDRTPQYIGDAHDDPRWVNGRFIHALGLRAYAGLPLISGDAVLGVLSILFAEVRQFDRDEQRLMEVLADHATIAIQNARLFERQRQLHAAEREARAEAERRAREAEEARALLETLLDHVPEGITIVGGPPDFRIRANSRYAQRLLDRPLEATLGMPVGEHIEAYGLFLADGRTRPRPEQMPLYRAARLGETVMDEEWVIVRPDGRRLAVLVSVTAIRVDGRIVGAINCWRDITERKQAEESVRRSARALHDFFESASIGFHWMAADGTIVRANRAELELLGCAREEYVGRHIAEFHVDPGVPADILDRLGRGESLRDYPAILRARDGSIREVLIDASGLWEDGALVHARCFTRDVTERNRAERMAAERRGVTELAAEVGDALAQCPLGDALQRCTEAIVRHLGAAFARIWLLDAAGQVLELKASAGRYTHLDGPHGRIPVGQLKIGRIAETWRPQLTNRVFDDPTIGDHAWARQEGMVGFAGYPLVAGKRLVGVLAMFSRTPLAESTLQALGGAASNIAVAVVRQQAEAGLRESEEYFRDLADRLPVIVGTGLPDGRVEWVNRLYLDYTGQTQAYVRSTPEAWAAAVHPDDREHASRTWRDSARAGRGFTMEVRLRRAADGAYRWHLSSAVPVHDADGHLVKFLGTSTDIEEQKRLEAALRDADRRKDDFLAILAHELRNPLGVVLNAVSILERLGDNKPEPVRARTLIRRQAVQLARLLDDLLDVARITHGHIELRRETVDMRSIADLAIEAQRHLVEQKRQRLTVTLPGQPVLVIGDAARLQQVVGNLLNNAAKYTPAGGSLWLGVEQAGDQALVRVRDTGRGIPTDRLEDVFDLFARGEEPLGRAESGLGIGLTLVRRLVELHEGTVTVSSGGPGRGAEFVVRLRLSPGPEPSGAAAAPAVTATRPRRIVVVEDNDDAREALVAALRLEGHDVLGAATGGAGVRLVVDQQPDVAIIDIGLPDRDGYDVCRELRAKVGSRVRLIAVTGYGQPADQRRAQEAGFDAHVVKPAAVDDLARAFDA